MEIVSSKSVEQLITLFESSKLEHGKMKTKKISEKIT